MARRTIVKAYNEMFDEHPEEPQKESHWPHVGPEGSWWYELTWTGLLKTLIVTVAIGSIILGFIKNADLMLTIIFYAIMAILALGLFFGLWAKFSGALDD